MFEHKVGIPCITSFLAGRHVVSGAKALERVWETPSISQAEIVRVLLYHLLNVHNNIHFPGNIKAFKDKEDPLLFNILILLYYNRYIYYRKCVRHKNIVNEYNNQ